MQTTKIETGMSEMIFINFAKLNYSCPHCHKEHNDEEDRLCGRLNKSKEGWIKLKCSKCKKMFGYTVDMTGQPVGFDLK